MSEKLKPCPFCGNEAVLFTGGEHLAYVGCVKCGAKLPACFGENKEAEAVEAWNRRSR